MIIIGEKINATRKSVKKALGEEDFERLKQLCSEQDAAGADYIDVNVGTGEGSVDDEVRTMTRVVQLLEEVTDKPLCIDSASPPVIEAGVKACSRATPLINSVNGSPARMDAILPLAAECGTPLIALAMGEGGIPATAEERVSVCEHIVKRGADFGLPPEQFFFDPLVLPLSTGETQGQTTLDALRAVKTRIQGAKTVMGLSNISFGLPRRSLINGALLTMAVGAGLDAVIIDPNDRKLISRLRAAEVVAGRDRRCRRYTRAHAAGQLTD